MILEQSSQTEKKNIKNTGLWERTTKLMLKELDFILVSAALFSAA